MTEGAVHGTLQKTGLSATAIDVLRRRAESLATEAQEEESGDSVAILLFRLGEEWYSVYVHDVREIYQEYSITPIPCVPDFIQGVVNIRGEIISVTDVSKMTHLGESTVVEEAAPAIVIQNGTCTTAMVVDEIGDIAEISRDSMEPSLSVIDKSQAEFLAGSVHYDGRLVGLLNIDRILEPIGVRG